MVSMNVSFVNLFFISAATTVTISAAAIIVSIVLSAAAIAVCVILCKKVPHSCWSVRDSSYNPPQLEVRVEKEVTPPSSSSPETLLRPSVVNTLEQGDYIREPGVNTQDYGGYTGDYVTNTHPTSTFEQREASLGYSDHTDSLSIMESEESSQVSEVLGKYRVLVVYSPNAALKDMILSRLVAGLQRYQELVIVSPDIVRIDKIASSWLLDEVDNNKEGKVHAVLCVWTQEFKSEWKGESRGESAGLLNSDLVRALKTVIEVTSFRDILRVATILLDTGDQEQLPVLLQAHPKFRIDDLRNIAAFVKGIPPYEIK